MRSYVLVALVALVGCTDTIFVNSVPQGATVYVEGQEAGKTPCSVDVKSSSRVVVKKPGFLDYRLVLTKRDNVFLEICTLGILGDEIEKSYALRLNEDDAAPAAAVPRAPSVEAPASAPRAPVTPPSAKRFCTSCGASLEDGIRFCGSCGAKR